MAKILGQVCHQTLYRASYFPYRKFLKGKDNLKEIQQKILEKQLQNFPHINGLSDFNLREASTYDSWAQEIEHQRLKNTPTLSFDKCDRYQPTSGSSSAIKWIPYSQMFLSEIDRVAAPWMHDLYTRYPKIRSGRHYWSLSWIPTELRQKVSGNINDDLELMPWWKRAFLSKTMAVSSDVARAKSSYLGQLATACFLVCAKDLSLISVWSPTFFLEMIKFIEAHRDQIAEILIKGNWGAEKDLYYLKAPFAPEQGNKLKNNLPVEQLWPSLGLISAWDSSTSAHYAKKLQEHFPNVPFQGKGLWATEGVLTFPFDGKFPLAYQSHYYEFIDLATDKIISCWELEKDQEVSPLMTTGNGLVRYRLLDRLRVTDFFGDVPCFLFLGRDHGIDMVGEKMAPAIVGPLLEEIAQKYRIQSICLGAVENDNQPFYLFLGEGNLAETKQDELACDLELKLGESFHYNLARDLGQLGKVQVLIGKQTFERYQKSCEAKGMVKGNLKVESLVKLSPSQYKELYRG